MMKDHYHSNNIFQSDPARYKSKSGQHLEKYMKFTKKISTNIEIKKKLHTYI